MSADSGPKIPVARPTLGPEEEAEVLAALRSGWITQGPRVLEFERRFAAAVGAKEAIAVTNGTVALFLGLHVLGIGAEDEVIVPSLSFIATANAIRHTGATPAFAEVDPRTYNLDSRSVESVVSARTRAILVVHQLGLPADLDALAAIAAKHGLSVVEDAACAVGSRHRGQPIGSGANLACFSFHPRKVITTGEGGMLTTSDPAMAARLRILRHQGMSVSDLERHHASRVITETYDEAGYNFRLSDLHAAVGLAQLRKLDALLQRRRAIAARYDAAFDGHPTVVPPHVPDYADPNYQSYIVRLRGASAARRNAFLDAMGRRGVATRRGLMAIHREACYAGAPRATSLRHTEEADAQTVILPMHGELQTEEQRRVIRAVEESLEESEAAP